MFTIVKRPLTKDEVTRLICDIKRYPHLAYVSEKRFMNIPYTYIAEVDGHFAGVCGVYEFESWVKLGPLVALQKYHGIGLGRALIEGVLNDFSDKNIHISSSNIKVQKVVASLGFTARESFFMLPNVVKKFLFGQLISMLSFSFITDAIRKNLFYRKGPMRWYVRYNRT